MALSRKISLAMLAALLVFILYGLFLSYLLYEKLYVDNMEKEMLETGERLAALYPGGPVEDAFIKEIESYGFLSKFEVFAVRNPRELSMCVPFEMDYEALISGEEREELLAGKSIFSKGHVDRLKRDVISGAIPLLNEKRLEGIIYLYYPLENVSEVTFTYAFYWLVGAIVFLLLLFTLGAKWIASLMKPLREMKTAAEQLSEGKLSVRVPTYPDDEIGQLARTFNGMAESMQREDEEQKEFLANVSHELRTPISYIQGYMEAIQTGVAKEKDIRTYQDIILRESKRMERLVDDLLDLAKLESKEFKLERMPIAIAQTIEDAVEKAEQKLSEKAIRLEKDLDFSLIAEVDEGRLMQMFLNLLDNAIRYTDEGGSIRVKLLDWGGEALISVADSGKGIPEEELAHLTKRFYRVNKARTRNQGGTGLGLAIVEKLAGLHGGTLEIRSTPGIGTEVLITLPLLRE